MKKRRKRRREEEEKKRSSLPKDSVVRGICDLLLSHGSLCFEKEKEKESKGKERKNKKEEKLVQGKGMQGRLLFFCLPL